MPQSVPSINAVAGSNTNLPINTLVQLNNVNSGGEVSFLWQIISQPAGAAVALSNTIIQNPTFTPTKEGTYLISLTVNGTLTSRIVAAVRELKSLTRVPAPQEKTETGAAAGWSTDVNALLLTLLNASADPGVIVGVAGSGLCPAGQVLYPSGTTTIKAGLPGEEVLLSLLPADFSADPTRRVYSRQEPLLLSLGGVDGNPTPANGALIRARAFGLYPAATGAAVGGAVWSDRNGLLSSSRDQLPRRVGIQVSATHVYFDGRYVSNAALDIFETTLANIPVGDANSIRLVCRSNVPQVSANGGAYVSLAYSDAPILTNGASAMSNEVNIAALTSFLSFIAAASGGGVAVQRFDAGDLGAKFAIRTQTGSNIIELRGDGSALFGAGIEVNGTIESLSGDLIATGNVQVDGNSTHTNSIATGYVQGAQSTLASTANVATPTTNVIHMTNNATINTIGTTGLADGFVLMILFREALTLTHDSAAPPVNTAALFLAGSTNFALGAETKITLALITNSSGRYWQEMSRTIP